MGCKESVNVITEPLLDVSTEIIGKFIVHNMGRKEGRMWDAIDMAFIERQLADGDPYYQNVIASYIMDGDELLSWGLLYELRESFGVYTYHMDVYTLPKFRGNGYGTEIVKALRKLHDGEIYVYKKRTTIYERVGL